MQNKFHFAVVFTAASLGFGVLASSAEEGFARYEGKPAELLTEEEAGELLGNPEGGELKVVELPGSNAKYGNVQYSWDGGRQQEIKAGSVSMKVPDPYKLTVGLPTEVKIYGGKTVLESFEAYHETLTKEQAAAAKAHMDEALAEHSKKTGELNSDEEKAVAGSVTDSALGGAMKSKWVAVQDLGDAAFWELNEKKLDILVGNQSLIIIADIGEDEAKCKEVALAVAKLVLD